MVNVRCVRIRLGPIRNLWLVSKLAGQLPSCPAGFETGYSFHTMNIRYEILCWPFVVKNLETTVYTISFVNLFSQLFKNNRRIARPSQLFENNRRIDRRITRPRCCKQANTPLVSVQPISESMNYCPVSSLSVSANRFSSSPASRFRSRPPSWVWSGPFPFTGYESGQPVSRLAGFETGWVANWALTSIATLADRNAKWIYLCERGSF